MIPPRFNRHSYDLPQPGDLVVGIEDAAIVNIHNNSSPPFSHLYEGFGLVLGVNASTKMTTPEAFDVWFPLTSDTRTMYGDELSVISKLDDDFVADLEEFLFDEVKEQI